MAVVTAAAGAVAAGSATVVVVAEGRVLALAAGALGATVLVVERVVVGWALVVVGWVLVAETGRQAGHHHRPHRCPPLS